MPIKVGGQSTRTLTYGTGRGGQRKYTLDLLEQQRRHRMRMQEYMASSMYRRLPEAEEGEWADPMAALGEEVQASRPPRQAGDLVPRSPRSATGSRGVPVRIQDQKRANERARQADMPLPYPEAAMGQELKTMQAQKRKNEAARRMAARQGRVLPDDKLPYPDVEPQFTSRREVEREQEVSDAALERSHREDMARQAQDAMAERQEAAFGHDIEMEQTGTQAEAIGAGFTEDEQRIQQGWYTDEDAKELRRINGIMRQLLGSERFTDPTEREKLLEHYNRRRKEILRNQQPPPTQDEQLIEDFGEEGAERFRGKVTKDPSGKWYSPTGVPESDESRDAKAYADREKRIRDRERKSMEADGVAEVPQFNSDAERKKWAREVEDRLDAGAPAGGAAPGKDLMSRAMDAADKGDPQAIEFLAGLAAKGDPKAIAFFRRKM